MLPKKLTQNFNPQNTFFTLASDAKRLPHIGFSSLLLPLLFILFGAIVSQLLFFAYTLGHPKSASPLTEELFILVGLFSLTLLAIWLWMKFFEGRSFRSVGLPKQCALKKYFTGFFLGILMLGSTLASMAVFGIIQIETESIIPIGVDAILPVTLLLFGYVIQGGSEEILFRGWQFQVISVRYKPWIGALVSSLVFALMHGLNYGINIVAIANLIFFSVLLILIVLNEGSLWSACGLHTSWNWTMGCVLGLDVSGDVTKSGVLIDLHTIGPDILSGGKFGPEASIITSAVLIAGIIFILIKKKTE